MGINVILHEIRLWLFRRCRPFDHCGHHVSEIQYEFWFLWVVLCRTVMRFAYINMWNKYHHSSHQTHDSLRWILNHTQHIHFVHKYFVKFLCRHKSKRDILHTTYTSSLKQTHTDLSIDTTNIYPFGWCVVYRIRIHVDFLYLCRWWCLAFSKRSNVWVVVSIPFLTVLWVINVLDESENLLISETDSTNIHVYESIRYTDSVRDPNRKFRIVSFFSRFIASKQIDCQCWYEHIQYMGGYMGN